MTATMTAAPRYPMYVFDHDTNAVLDERGNLRCGECFTFLRRTPDEVTHELDFDYDHYDRSVTKVDVTTEVRVCSCGTTNFDHITIAEHAAREANKTAALARWREEVAAFNDTEVTA